METPSGCWKTILDIRLCTPGTLPCGLKIKHKPIPFTSEYKPFRVQFGIVQTGLPAELCTFTKPNAFQQGKTDPIHRRAEKLHARNGLGDIQLFGKTLGKCFEFVIILPFGWPQFGFTFRKSNRQFFTIYLIGAKNRTLFIPVSIGLARVSPHHESFVLPARHQPDLSRPKLKLRLVEIPPHANDDGLPIANQHNPLALVLAFEFLAIQIGLGCNPSAR